MMISTPHYNKMGMPTESINVDFLKSIQHEAQQRQLRRDDEHGHDSDPYYAQNPKEQQQERQKKQQQLQQDQHKMLMKDIRNTATTCKALRDFKINVVLQELMHVTNVFGTLCPTKRRDALMREIRQVGKVRAMAREHRHFIKIMDQQQKLGQELVIQRRALMEGIRTCTSSRKVEKDMKHHMLLELHRQKAFRFPSIRKRLLHEIREYGIVREQVKENHKCVIMEMKEYFFQKAMQHQVENRKELMMELCRYASARNLARKMKRQLMGEIHKQSSQRDVANDIHGNLLRDLNIKHGL